MVYLANSKQDILIKKRGEFIDETTQPIMLHVATHNAYIGKDRKKNDAPYIMISGIAYKISFNLDGSDEQLIQPTLPLTLRYELNMNDKLAIVSKGYWDVSLFKCPEIISNNPDFQQPITKTPVKICRYKLQNDIMVTVEFEGLDKVYTTDGEETGYGDIIDPYFDYQTAQPEINDAMKQKNEETYISTYDSSLEDEIAAMFANRNAEETLESNEELDKLVAQEKNRQAEITADMNRLLQGLPTVIKEREKAKAHDENAKKAKEPNNTKMLDDTFLPSEEVINADFGGDAELAAFVGESLKPETKVEEPTPSEPSSIEEDLNKLFEEFEQSVQAEKAEADATNTSSKEDVEAELQSATTVKSNKNLGKLTTPEDESQKGFNKEYNI